MDPTFVACPPSPHMMTLKSSPNLHAPPSPINMTTMIRQHTKFPPSAIPPGKLVHQSIHCPTANFRPLLRGSLANPTLSTALDTYFTPREPGNKVGV